MNDGGLSLSASRQLAGLPFKTGLILLAFLTAAVILYAAAWSEAPVKARDSEGYLKVARDLLDFRLDELHLRTPGYGLLLALTGSAHEPGRALFFVGLAMHCAVIWLLAALLHMSGLQPRWVLLFGFILLLPPFVESAAYVLTENMTEFLLALGVGGVALGVCHRKLIWLCTGALALGVCGVTHPIYQAFPPVVAIVLLAAVRLAPWVRLRFRAALRSSLVVLGGFGLIVGGTVFYNLVYFDYVGLTPFTGFTLTTKTAAFVERLPDEHAVAREALIAARNADLTAPGSTHTAASYIWRARDPLSRATGLEGVALSKYLVKINLLLIREAPLAYSHDVFVTTARLWAPSSGQGLASGGARLFQAAWAFLDLFITAVFATQVVLVLGASVLIYGRRFVAGHPPGGGPELTKIKIRTLGYLLALAAVFYTVLICGLFGPGLPRYRAPLAPLILYLSFLGLQIVCSMTASRKAVSHSDRPRN